ncbi:MAG: hypothetical protein LBH04_07970 [Tannerellaceae bacterium]|jgi:hypothetical protein|nr:hypothetical protein [Tannerellaceae bacterium]
MLIILFLYSCSSKGNRQNITRLLHEWSEKEIVFSEQPVFIRFTKDDAEIDTVDCLTSLKSEYKVLIYVDSTGCTACKLKLPVWKDFMTEVDSIADKQIPFLFFFHSNDLAELRYLFLSEVFDYPVCVDTGDELNQINQFPKIEAFHVFLLNRDNKVIVIGNPIQNRRVRELYLSQIRKEVS